MFFLNRISVFHTISQKKMLQHFAFRLQYFHLPHFCGVWKSNKYQFPILLIYRENTYEDPMNHLCPINKCQRKMNHKK